MSLNQTKCHNVHSGSLCYPYMFPPPQGSGGTWGIRDWGDENFWVYQRPVYKFQQGLNATFFQLKRVNPVTDSFYMFYSGSRWLGMVFPGEELANHGRDYWRSYVKDFHAFWEDAYTSKTSFASDPTTQSSIIGVDFYLVFRQGEEFGPFGELKPLSTYKGRSLFWPIRFCDSSACGFTLVELL